jgi:glycosyltransferase involved in cell wall biosynthesis
MNCHNGEKYLREAIDSVYNQSYKNWEIIFWDNASTDESGKIAKSYDNKLKYFYTQELSLLGRARGLAAEQVRGEYLAFLDCDDLWCGDKLEKQIRIFEDSEESLGIVYGRSEIIYEDGSDNKVFYEGYTLPEGMVFCDFAKNNFIQFVSAMVDVKKFFSCGGFPPHLRHATDYWIFAHLTHEYPVAALQEVCCKYRTHSCSLSSSLPSRMTGLLESIEALSCFLPEKSAEIGIKFYYTYLALLWIKKGNLYQAITILSNNFVWTVFFKYVVHRVFKLDPYK